jgi:hypothetical protein
VQTKITLIENGKGFLFLIPCPSFPLSLCPSEQGCEAAQFCNEDRIKISAETVQSSLTITKDAASQSTRHRITPSVVRNRTFAILKAGAYHQLHEWILLLPVLFAAHRGPGNLLNPV